MRVNIIITLILSLVIITLSSCGGQLAGSVGGDCYECQGTDVPCTCPQGYGGYYNPDALDIYRPGRFDDLNNPTW